jgi:hypothetical protein
MSLTNDTNNGIGVNFWLQHPILDRLLEHVVFTDNTFDCVEFKVIQEICREPFNKGSRIYRDLSKNKIIEMMYRDPRWNSKIIDFRMKANNLSNVVIRLRLI